MPVTNLLKKQIDQPVFEWMRFSPITTSSVNGLAGLNGQTGERYFYMVDTTNVNYRYDTWSDSWGQISPLPVSTLSTFVKMRATKSYGHRGHVINATSTTLQIGGCGYATKAAVGMKIRIVAGKGAGQERTITAVADPVIEDFGYTSSGQSNLISDSTKKWRFNQYDGYTCRLINAGSSAQLQTRRIQYNSQTAITFNDTNFQPIEWFNNMSFNTTAPYPTSVGALHYVIESVNLTVDTSWSVTPDGSSIFMIMSGGVWLTEATNRNTLYFYDILSDTWIQKTGVGLGSDTFGASTTDFVMCLIDEASGPLLAGATATSATSKTLVNTGATMEVDRYANHQIRITSGTGIGQQRRIVAHGATFMHVEKNWDITPDSTSQYQIWPDTDKLYFFPANGYTNIMQHSIDSDLWSFGQTTDYGVARSISASPYAGTSYGAPHQGYAVSSIVRTTSGILSGSVNAGGTNYVVGDLVTCSTTGTNGTFFVTSVSSTGAVTGLQLAASGSGYSAGSSNTTGGAGSGLTITLTVGTTALVTTATSHDFRDWGGEQVKIAGCATDTSFNAVFSILGVGSTSTFSIAAPASSASPTAATSQSATVLVDAEKTWAVNEHVGKTLRVYTSTGVNPTNIPAYRITSNTANTITISTAITTPTNGQTRYVIHEPSGIGPMVTSRIKNREPYGFATSATATTLVDTTKSWTNNQWQNFRVRITAGTGLGNESAISSNTSNTLTVASWGVATPDSTSKYEIMDSFGIATSGSFGVVNDTSKNWGTNQLVGKRALITGGTTRGSILTITSNTATSFSGGSQTVDSTSTYVIYDQLPRQTQIFEWLYGMSDSTKKGRYIVSPYNEATTTPFLMDFYDIPLNRWILSYNFSPLGVATGTGTMYAYDGGDILFVTIAATGRIHEINLNTLQMNAAGQTPYAHGTALFRQGMQVLTTDDGLKYLYIQRHSGNEMWRTLKFW